MFTKEFILINDELIIYITFLTITFLAIQSFSFLRKTFEDIQADIKNNLISLSLNTQTIEKRVIQKADLLLESLHTFDINLPEPLDISESKIS